MQQKKKIASIFICIDWFFPAYKAGGPVQSVANLVNNFAGENTQYKIFCSNTDLDGTVLNDIVADKWVRYNERTEVWYSSKKKRQVSVLKVEIKNAGTDIIFINGIYSWFFNLVPLLFCSAPRKIISVRGMLHPGALSQKPLKKKLFLFFWKLTGLHKRYEFHASSAEECTYISNVFGNTARIHFAQNFSRTLAPLSPCKNQNELRLVSVALISPMKNHLLVLKALQKCTGNIRYDIYGPVKDAVYWSECEKEIKNLPAAVTVQYHGDILPDKVEAILHNAHVFVLPSKSENFGHAIYEALSSGKPVITSVFTPWNNLAAGKAGINVDIDKTESLTGAIDFFVQMVQDDFSIWSMGAAGYAAHALNISEIKNQYSRMFNIQQL